MVDPSTPLPPWFTEDDLNNYGALYDKSGFTTALQVPYRSLIFHVHVHVVSSSFFPMLVMNPYKVFRTYVGDRSLGEEFNIRDQRVEVPMLLMMGEKDYFLKFPGVEEYIRSGKAKNHVPDLEISFLPEGTHFSQEQFPEQVNQLLLSFLTKHI